MCARQIASGHQEFVHDLPTGKDKGLFEEFDPLVFGECICINRPENRTLFAIRIF
jgi:hypothetical protein